MCSWSTYESSFVRLISTSLSTFELYVIGSWVHPFKSHGRVSNPAFVRWILTQIMATGRRI